MCHDVDTLALMFPGAHVRVGSVEVGEEPSTMTAHLNVTLEDGYTFPAKVEYTKGIWRIPFGLRVPIFQ